VEQVNATAGGNTYTPSEILLPPFVLEEARAAALVASAKEKARGLSLLDPMEEDVDIEVMSEAQLRTRQHRQKQHPHVMWVQGASYLRIGQFVAALRCLSAALVHEQESR